MEGLWFTRKWLEKQKKIRNYTVVFLGLISSLLPVYFLLAEKLTKELLINFIEVIFDFLKNIELKYYIKLIKKKSKKTSWLICTLVNIRLFRVTRCNSFIKKLEIPLDVFYWRLDFFKFFLRYEIYDDLNFHTYGHLIRIKWSCILQIPQVYHKDYIFTVKELAQTIQVHVSLITNSPTLENCWHQLLRPYSNLNIFLPLNRVPRRT